MVPWTGDGGGGDLDAPHAHTASCLLARSLACRRDTAAPARPGGGASGSGGGSGGSGGEAASTSVINYTYFDSARKDSLLPAAKRRPEFTAADAMKMQQQAGEGSGAKK